MQPGTMRGRRTSASPRRTMEAFGTSPGRSCDGGCKRARRDGPRLASRPGTVGRARTAGRRVRGVPEVSCPVRGAARQVPDVGARRHGLRHHSERRGTADRHDDPHPGHGDGEHTGVSPGIVARDCGQDRPATPESADCRDRSEWVRWRPGAGG